MKIINSPLALRAFCSTAGLACFALAITLGQMPSLHAASTPPAHPTANQGPILPLTAKFEQMKSKEAPNYVLKLTNDSKKAITASATVYLSVMSHNRDKARQVAAHVIEPGKTWTIDELAALDKVTVTAEGFAPLELVVK